MKIGIVTIYHKNKNYGANLQAYALCAAIKKLDASYDVEQISYVNASPKLLIWKMSPLQFVKKGIRFVWYRTGRRLIRYLASLKDRKYRAPLAARTAAILDFNQNKIPHSKLYTAGTISGAADEYDVFITGSDQVWNPMWYNPAYRLDFVPEGRAKLSYAASISRDSLADEEQEIFRRSLADYTGISVREEKAIELLSPLVSQEVEWVLDPTLLLSREEWDTVATERLIPERYLFCYFLGEGTAERELATAYAEAHGLALVTLPFLHGVPRDCDRGFGEKQLYEISPADFVSLVKHAECVFTDSFHATLFSGIYGRQYVAFERSLGGQSMGSRLRSLLSLYETEERFCDTPERATLAYIEALPPIDYSRPLVRLGEMKERSLAFLTRNLEKAKV